MSRGRWELPWFRVWTDFDEDDKWTSKATNDELGAWTRLLRLANAQKIRGEIKVENNLPYSQEQLFLLLKGGQTYLTKWAKQGAIKIINGIIFIVNWEHWQGIRNEGHPGREAKVKERHENPPAPKIKIQKQTGFNPLAYFIDEFLANRETPYPNADPGKDGSLLKQIVADNGIEKYKQALAEFWKSEDTFVKNRKFDVTAFKSQISILLTSDRAKNNVKFMGEVM